MPESAVQCLGHPDITISDAKPCPECGAVADGTPVVCKGTMVGVPKGTPAIVRHQSPGGFSNLPRMYWIELDDYIYWSHGHSEAKGYWGTAAEFEVVQ